MNAPFPAHLSLVRRDGLYDLVIARIAEREDRVENDREECETQAEADAFPEILRNVNRKYDEDYKVHDWDNE